MLSCARHAVLANGGLRARKRPLQAKAQKLRHRVDVLLIMRIKTEFGVGLQLLVEEYMSWLKYEQGRSDKTLVKYRYHIYRFFKELGTSQFEIVNLEQTRAVKRRLVDQGRDKSWVNFILTSTRGFYTWLRDEKKFQLALSPEQIKGYGMGQGLRQKKIEFLEKEELEELMTLVDTSNITGLRLRTWLEVCYGTGVRAFEALTLNRNDLEQKVLPIIGKGNRGRYLYPSDRAREWAKKYVESRHDTHEALFVCATDGEIKRWSYESMRKAVSALKVKFHNDKRVHSHTLRHTAGTHLYAEKEDIVVPQVFLGHVDINTTKKFYVGTNIDAMIKKVNESLGHVEK